MNSSYVIFFCDECDLLKETITHFSGLYPEVKVITFEDREKMMAHLEKHEPPRLVLVYVTGPDKEYISFLKAIRQSINSSLIPVLIYHTLPSEEEVGKLLKR